MSKILSWRLHGETPCRDLVAGLLPAHGQHFIIAPNEDERRAIVAGLSVAIAAGNVAADVVQESKKSDGWRLASGFLGLATGEPCGVAIVGAATQADIAVAAAFRGIKSRLPIATSTASKNDIVSARLHDLRSDMNVGLVVVTADWSRGVDEVKRIHNYRGDFAVLVVSATEPPESLVKSDAHVLRVENGELALAHPATATPWSVGFSLEPIKIGVGKAWGVRLSAEAVSVPQFAPGAEEAPQPREAYAGVVIYAVGARSYGLHPSEPARWPEGARFEEQPFEAARAASEIEGRVQIILALGPESKLDPKEERRRINTALAQFKIAQRVDVTIAAQKLLDARDVRDRIVPAA